MPKRVRPHGQHRWYQIKYHYGLTKEDYDKIWEGQNGCCAICRCWLEEHTTGPNSPHVDHCHTMGRIRGLLCHSCNIGIGGLKDDPVLVARALEYLS